MNELIERITKLSLKRPSDIQNLLEFVKLLITKITANAEFCQAVTRGINRTIRELELQGDVASTDDRELSADAQRDLFELRLTSDQVQQVKNSYQTFEERQAYDAYRLQLEHSLQAPLKKTAIIELVFSHVALQLPPEKLTAANQCLTALCNHFKKEKQIIPMEFLLLSKQFDKINNLLQNKGDDENLALIIHQENIIAKESAALESIYGKLNEDKYQIKREALKKMFKKEMDRFAQEIAEEVEKTPSLAQYTGNEKKVLDIDGIANAAVKKSMLTPQQPIHTEETLYAKENKKYGAAVSKYLACRDIYETLNDSSLLPYECLVHTQRKHANYKKTFEGCRDTAFITFLKVTGTVLAVTLGSIFTFGTQYGAIKKWCKSTFFTPKSEHLIDAAEGKLTHLLSPSPVLQKR